MDVIKIKGARVNNLKDVALEIPINKVTCFAGPSGSGKSSIAFQTLYSESKRRFLNSFPTYLKFFSDRPAPVDVDVIEPVLPVFGLPQINPVIGTRSTVADIMHLTELLQNLFSSTSVELCPVHKTTLVQEDFSQLVKEMINNSPLRNCEVIHILTDSESFVEILKDSPFPNRSLNEESLAINSFNKDDYYWEVQRFKTNNLQSLNAKLKPYLEKNVPLYFFGVGMDSVKRIKSDFKKKCPHCDYQGQDVVSLPMFSPYNALGACSSCNGFGANLVYDEDKLILENLSVNKGGIKFLEYKRFGDLIKDLKHEMKKQGIALDKPVKQLPKKFKTLLYNGGGRWCGFNELFSYLESKKYKPSVRIFLRGIQKERVCEICHGSRLNPTVHNFYAFQDNKINFKDLWSLTISDLLKNMSENQKRLYVSSPYSFKLIKKIVDLLTLAEGIGLGHLGLNRKSKTVSAGEYQRLLLLKYLSYDGTGSLFIFDEPSLGLTLNEQKKLLKSFRKLIETGNTVVLVEHSRFFHENSDHFVLMGPGAGKFGGEILYQGKFAAQKFQDEEKLPLKKKIVEVDRQWISITGATLYNKKFKDVRFPLGEISLVQGASGSGKSSVLVNTFANKLHEDLHGESLNLEKGGFTKVNYPSSIEDIIVIDANLNRYSSRSSVGSLTGLYSIVRKHFLNTPVAKSMGVKEGHLSANSSLGQCPSCEGRGVKIVEMQFLEDIVLECEDCQGKKIKQIYASLTDGDINVYESYSMPLSSIVPKLKLTPKFRRIWEFMKMLKLDYLSLDRQVSALSGGEKQRLYLLSKLEKEVKNSVLIFENISFGLSRSELISLAKFFTELTLSNNTIVIIDQDEFFKEIATHKVSF